jgi:hypothetical protein
MLPWIHVIPCFQLNKFKTWSPPLALGPIGVLFVSPPFSPWPHHTETELDLDSIPWFWPHRHSPDWSHCTGTEPGTELDSTTCILGFGHITIRPIGVIALELNLTQQHVYNHIDRLKHLFEYLMHREYKFLPTASFYIGSDRTTDHVKSARIMSPWSLVSRSRRLRIRS